MTEIQRYVPAADGGGAEMEQDDYGAWVAFDDHQACIKALVKERDKLAKAVEALNEIKIKAFRQTDIGENHAAGLSGASDRLCFLEIRDAASAALAELEAKP